jgi:YHS domain-containing protein
MKKIALLSLMVSVLAVGAFAQKDQKPAKKEDTKMTCAVMKDDPVVVAKATKDGLFADYKGRRYFFCCAGCKPKFEKDPAKYAKTAPSIPTPKADKKG